MQHERLVEYLREHREFTGMSMAELSRRMGLNDGS